MVESKVNETGRQSRRFYRQVPNFNLVPLEYRRPTVFSPRPLLRLAIAVIIVGELFFLWDLSEQKASIETAVDAARLQIQQTENKIAMVNAEGGLKKERQSLQDDWKALTANRPDWPEILSAFFKSKPAGIDLTSLDEKGGVVKANGFAPDYSSLLQYRSVLLGSPAVSQIVSLDSSTDDGVIAFAVSVEIKGHPNADQTAQAR